MPQSLIPRRDFLAALTLGPLALRALPHPTEIRNYKIRIACQTNAWRIDPRDFTQLLQVLAKLRELGYAGFETGFRNVEDQFTNAERARAQIERTGLAFFGVHIFLEQYDPQTQIAPLELIQRVADGAAALGAQRVIVSGAGLIDAGRVDEKALQRKAGALNIAGRYCRSRRLRLAYHNHAPEFEQNGLEIEGLYRLTDPALVDFLTDCGWAWRGGVNVPQFFARHHRRIVGLHLRDFRHDTQVPLGQGDFPLNELAAQIRRVNWSGWALNEEERLSGEKPGEAAVAPARATLRKVFGY